jgi:mannitol-1-phosphate/altronate dehydrogenase
MTYVGVAVASYIRYVTGIDNEGLEVGEVLDPLAEQLQEPARAACQLHVLPDGVDPSTAALSNGVKKAVYDPRGVISLVFGPEVAANAGFVRVVSTKLESICEKGMMYTLLNAN